MVSLVGMAPGRVTQAWHLSVSTQFNLCKWALRGMWPLRICMSRLLWALNSPCKIILNFVKGKDLSTRFTLHSPGYSIWNGYGMDGIHKIGYGFHGIGDGFHLHGYLFHGMCDGFRLHSMVIPWSFHPHSIPIPWSFHGHSTLIPPPFHGHSTSIPYSFHPHSMVIPPPFHSFHTHSNPIPWSFHGMRTSEQKFFENKLY
jgi:hypothetical protein